MKVSAAGIIALISITNVASEVSNKNAHSREFVKVKRELQQTVPIGGICSTMIPPSPLPPDDSTCWQWWVPPPDGVIPSGSPTPPTGCNYAPCEAAVCDCDSYCCETAWDLSCRGYYMQQGDSIENNYFVPGCSAKLLCCEPESAYPDPPVGGALPPVLSATTSMDNSNACIPGSSDDCCITMIPASFLAPDDSSCWQWWEVPPGGILPPGSPPPPTGCNYKPCQDAVCQCDPYCCSTAWDLSCRGYQLSQADTVENNYFVNGCSARILCCEQESAYPDPPVGGAGGGGFGGGFGGQTISTETRIKVGVVEKDTIQTNPTTTTILLQTTRGGKAKKGGKQYGIYGGQQYGIYGGQQYGIYGGKAGGKRR